MQENFSGSQILGPLSLSINTCTVWSLRICSYDQMYPHLNYLTCRSARLHRQAKSIPWNRFLGSLKVYKFGLRTETYHVIEELPEGAPVLLLLEPEGVEVEAEGSSICIVMSSLMQKKIQCFEQRALNDILRTKLSRHRVIWLLPHPLPSLSRQQVVSLSQSSCVSPVELFDGREGGGLGEKPNHTTARKPGSL